jgi:hypothetical protein
MIKPRTPYRYIRIVMFNHCEVHSPNNAWTPSCWNTTAASQHDADLEAASVQQSAENYLSFCRQRNRYQTGDQTLHHPYIIDIHVCKIVGRSLVQAVSSTAEDLSRNQILRFVVDILSLGQVSYEHILFHLTASWHQWFTFLLHLSSKQNKFSSSKLCAVFWGFSSLLCQVICCC